MRLTHFVYKFKGDCEGLPHMLSVGWNLQLPTSCRFVVCLRFYTGNYFGIAVCAHTGKCKYIERDMAMCVSLEARWVI